VTFNEDSIFDGKKEAQQIELDQLQTVISSIEEPEPEEISTTDQQMEHEGFTFLQGFNDDDTGVYEVGEPSGDQPMDIDKPGTEFEYPTPAATPPAGLLAGTISEGQMRHKTSANFEP
jgi:hypothetical protein